MRQLVRLGLLLLIPGFALGAAQERSLGLTLGYLRVHHLPEDLPETTEPRKNPLVLDLRFVKANRDAMTAFTAWLHFQSGPTTPLFVLVNADTDSALVGIFATNTIPGVITLGPAGDGIKPDVAIAVKSEVDRKAYDALDHGTSLDDLIKPKLEKVRHDEAAAAKERNNPSVEVDPPFPEAGSALETKEKPAETKKPDAIDAPFDLVLQRAVQVYRSLVALKKI